MDTKIDSFSGQARSFYPGPHGLDALLDEWRQGKVWHQVNLDHEVPGRLAETVPFPKDLSAGVTSALRGRGVEALYTHQLAAYEAVQAGRDVVIATPTASGKSLCYNLPILNELAADTSARALYLFPTKALAGIKKKPFVV